MKPICVESAIKQHQATNSTINFIAWWWPTYFKWRNLSTSSKPKAFVRKHWPLRLAQSHALYFASDFACIFTTRFHKIPTCTFTTDNLIGLKTVSELVRSECEQTSPLKSCTTNTCSWLNCHCSMLPVLYVSLISFFWHSDLTYSL